MKTDRSPLLSEEASLEMKSSTQANVQDTGREEEKAAAGRSPAAAAAAAPPPAAADGGGGGGGGGRPRAETHDERFECNVCLGGLVDPVVTRCGQLYCWPCLYRWLSSNHRDCPVCKAGVTVDNIIPLYCRGADAVDPRTKTQPGGGGGGEGGHIPSRPAAERPEVPQATNGIPNLFGGNTGGVTFSAGFGFFPSLFGLQFQSFNTAQPQQNNEENMTAEERQQAFLSRLLLMLGSFIILCLLLF